MQLQLEANDSIGIFTIIGYCKNKKSHFEYSLLPCSSIALFAHLNVTTKILNAVVLLDVKYNKYHLVLTIDWLNKEELHDIILINKPKIVNGFLID